MTRKKRGGRAREIKQAEAPVRRFPRIPAKNSIVVRKLGGPAQGGLTTTAVMGLGGCSFLHAEPQGVGETLFLTILIGRELADAKVRVVYEKPIENGAYEIGVEFIEVPPAHLELIQGFVGAAGNGPS
jgi:hypothetical protein